MGSRLEANSAAVRKRIESHTFDDEEGDEYGGSKFGGFTDYFRRKKIKLQNLDADLRSQSGDKAQIFKGIVAHVNGYTQPSLNDLHTLIVQHGGGFMQYLDGKTTVTHIIASSLTPKKAEEFSKYRIVKPAWVVDSIREGRLLPWNDYRVVDQGESQKLLAFSNGTMSSRTNVKAKGYRDQTDASWYTNQLRGSQVGAPTSTPSGTLRSRFSTQPLLTSDDDIEDLPTSHQSSLGPRTQAASIREQESVHRPGTLIAPPKSSPSHPHSCAKDPPETDKLLDDQDDDLYADSLPPHAGHAKENPNVTDAPPDDAAENEAPPNRPLTAEQHNAILLKDPNIRKSTVVDPNFLEQYYRESRLHHLSTWKADLKSQLQALASEKSLSQKTRQKRPVGARRYILHVDFDSFFAAVSVKKNPRWKDKPCAVAHGNGSGSEIASCNYPARQFGVKNGMWMKKALEVCPDLKVLPYDFPAYEEASRAFYDAILGTGGIVQSVSIDEALVDVSVLCIADGGGNGRNPTEGSIYREQAKADEIAQSLRDLVKEKTACNVSVGIGGNILLAKVALRKAKPAGQHQIKPEEVLDFIGELQVQDLPGVAWSIGGKLEEIGIRFVKDIRSFSKEQLVQTLGPKTGEKLWDYSRGIDRAEVGEQVVRKSVSAEVNWGVRFENHEQADEFIGSLCGELQKRLLKEKVKGRQFTMKVMRRSADAPLDPPKHLGHGKCDTFNKSLALGVATNSKDILTKEALSILKGFGFSPGELRGIGMQMTRLEPMKTATDGNVESSQRRLQFKVGAPGPKSIPESKHVPNHTKVLETDPIQDDPETPKKPRPSSPDHIPFGAPELNASTPSRRPLNMLGTQFILPTQVDPKVLAELPADIRTKLLRQNPRPTSPTPNRNAPSPPSKPTSFPLTALPAPSQLDPSILDALPPDVRAEILSQYAHSATPSSPSKLKHPHADQTLLPQSPRKTRIIGISSKRPSLPPIKRGRGRPPKSAQLAAAAALASTKTKGGRTLTQANFISKRNPAREEPVSAPDGAEDLDPDFLAALPADLRAELVADHKAQKLRAQRLAVQRNKPRPALAPPRRVQRIKVPRPRKATFTMARLSKEGELRGAVKEWVQEFAEEGPYLEDVGALVRFLGRVVGEEGDLGKAVGVVKWLEWVVGDMEEGMDGEKWAEAVDRVKEGVRGAAGERGLGRGTEWVSMPKETRKQPQSSFFRSTCEPMPPHLDAIQIAQVFEQHLLSPHPSPPIPHSPSSNPLPLIPLLLLANPTLHTPANKSSHSSSS
ncbi:DNA repair protein [Polyplosphaeria fusca]|uniref:DNA repair protein REV1 n=1 Tax=Polyplosphaeria fusca TaxID=682080 RepID=A0A9P4QMK3_9PLEO|nr:DNA repair protein [Polyplosphaeria fusca]